jgi:bacteriocin-like protein
MTDSKELIAEEIQDDELKAIVGGMVGSVRSGGAGKTMRTSRTGRTGNSGASGRSGNPRGGGPPQIPL